jgi:uncharacterized membrane protein YesL
LSHRAESPRHTLMSTIRRQPAAQESRERLSRHRQPTTPTQPQRVPSVAIAFRTLGRTLRHGYENLWTLALSGLIWYIGALLILPIGVVTAGLHRVAQPMTEERAANWREVYAHARQDLGWGSLLTGVLALGFVVIVANLNFYSTATTPLLQAITILFLTLFLIWTSIALFAFPMALRQRDRRLRTTLWNALLMTMGNAPGVMISMILLAMICVVLAVIPPLFLLLPGIITLWGQENVRLLLVAAGYLQRDEFADRERR